MNKQQNSRIIVKISVIVAGLLFGLMPIAQAGWNQSAAGTYNYTNTANWVGAIVDHQFTSTAAGSQTIQFTGNSAVTNLTYAAAPGAYNLPSITFMSSSGPFTLTLKDATRFMPWFNVSGVGGPIVTFGSATAGEVLNITLAGAAPTIVSEYSASGTSRLRFLNTISGSAGLTTAGSGLTELQGTNTWTGPLNVQAGGVRLQGANGTLATTTINVSAGAGIELGNDIVNNNRLDDSATINLNGGYTPLVVNELYGNSRQGNFLLSGYNGVTPVTETVGTINLQSGLSRVSARVRGLGTSYGNSTLTAGSLTRGVGAAVMFAGGQPHQPDPLLLGGELNGGVGAQSYIKFTSAPTLTGGILPYALVGHDAVFAADREFATYSGTDGIVRYGKTGTYVTTINAATAADNVRVTVGETWTGARTMNSLNVYLANSSLNGGTVTLASGAIIASSPNSTLQLNCALDFNNVEAFLYSLGGGSLLVQAALPNIGANGINFASVSTFSGGNNAETIHIGLNSAAITIAAPSRILMGTLNLFAGDPLANSALTINQGGTLGLPASTVRNVGSLAGEGQVRLSALESGASGSTLVVGSNNANTVFSGSIHAGQWVYGRLDNGVFANPGATGGNLVKIGTGSLTLSGLSSYNGTTTVRQGTLIAGATVASTLVYGGGAGALSASMNISANTLAGNLADNNKVVIQSRFGSQTGYTPGTLYYVVNANGTTFGIADTPGGAAKTISGSSVYWAKIDDTQLATGSGDTFTLPSGWNLANGNTVVFSALPLNPSLLPGIPYYVRDVAGSTFKVSASPGGVAVANLPSGSYGVVRPGAFGSGTNAVVLGDASTGANAVSLLAGGAYTIERDITVANQGAGTTIGGLTNTVSYFTGTITLNKTVDLTAATNGTVYFNATGSGKITGSGGVNITGSGTVMLGTGNDYSGVTTVKSNATWFGAGPIPAGLAFEATGNLAVTLTPTPDAYTPLNVTGTVDVTGATLQIAPLTFAPTIGSSYLLIANDSSDAVVGQFAQTRYSLMYNGHEYTGRVRTNGGTGNDVVLEFPAKGTVVMMQ